MNKKMTFKKYLKAFPNARYLILDENFRPIRKCYDCGKIREVVTIGMWKPQYICVDCFHLYYAKSLIPYHIPDPVM